MIDDASAPGAWGEFIVQRARQGFCELCGCAPDHPEARRCPFEDCEDCVLKNLTKEKNDEY
jgi:hypothetical protein